MYLYIDAHINKWVFYNTWCSEYHGPWIYPNLCISTPIIKNINTRTNVSLVKMISSLVQNWNLSQQILILSNINKKSLSFNFLSFCSFPHSPHRHTYRIPLFVLIYLHDKKKWCLMGHLRFPQQWRWRQQGPPKQWHCTMSLHSIATQKTMNRNDACLEHCVLRWAVTFHILFASSMLNKIGKVKNVQT